MKWSNSVKYANQIYGRARQQCSRPFNTNRRAGPQHQPQAMDNNDDHSSDSHTRRCPRHCGIPFGEQTRARQRHPLLQRLQTRGSPTSTWDRYNPRRHSRGGNACQQPTLRRPAAHEREQETKGPSRNQQRRPCSSHASFDWTLTQNRSGSSATGSKRAGEPTTYVWPQHDSSPNEHSGGRGGMRSGQRRTRRRR